MSLRVAMLSVHTCPLAALGGKETGGMNVYVRELSRELGRMGLGVDVFTRSQDPTIRRVVPLGAGARVIHLPAGPEAPMQRERIHAHLDQFVDGVDAWRIENNLEYDLVHAHYWLSGVVGLALRERWGVPVLQMFHTLGRFKNGAARRYADLEPTLRLDEVKEEHEPRREPGPIGMEAGVVETDDPVPLEHHEARRGAAGQIQEPQGGATGIGQLPDRAAEELLHPRVHESLLADPRAPVEIEEVAEARLDLVAPPGHRHACVTSFAAEAAGFPLELVTVLGGKRGEVVVPGPRQVQDWTALLHGDRRVQPARRGEAREHRDRR